MLGGDAGANSMTETSSGAIERPPASRIADLEAQLAEVTSRLREADHRIKNDLQLINSIFVLQLRNMPAGPERDLVRAALERVGAVSAVHRRLDVMDDPKHFEASGLVREMVEEAISGARRPDVRVDLDLAPVTVPTRQAAPLALIVGELMHNGLRHAFPGRPGAIRVGFRSADGVIRLSVADDGVGLAPGCLAPSGFGTTLVALLAQQLRGEVEVRAAAPGLRIVVSFPESP